MNTDKGAKKQTAEIAENTKEVVRESRRINNFHEVHWNDGKGTVYGMAFADFNGDGWPDIVGARSDAPNEIWFSTEPMLG